MWLSKLIKKMNQKGQSILEVAVSLGLVTVIITILTVTTINGLKNSQFAKNQVLASSFAQQGVELVKSMRQRNCTITINQGDAPGTYYWYDSSKGPLIWGANALRTEQNGSNNFVFMVDSNNCNTYESTATVGGELLNKTFNRKIKIEKINDVSIRVTVSVTWTDFSGDHRAENVTILTSY